MHSSTVQVDSILLAYNTAALGGSILPAYSTAALVCKLAGNNAMQSDSTRVSHRHRRFRRQ